MTNATQSNEQLSRLQKAAYALKELRAELDGVKEAQREPIAIVGMSGRFPGASNCHELWELLRSGTDAVTEIPEERWSLAQYYDANHNAAGKMNARCGGFLSQVDHFDPGFFGIPAREAVKMDPQQRLLLEVAWEALEDAGCPPRSLAGTQTGTYIGINQIDYALKQFDAVDDMDIYTTTGNGFCFSSGRISYTLGLQGPNMAVDTACSSSLVAVHLACQALRARECDLALAGGVQLNLIPTFHLLLAKTQSLSPTGRCNTFSAAADGLIMGEGCGMVVLKRLADAVANRDRVLALIRASGVNHGGSASGITVPSEVAQEALVRQVLAQAQADPAEVGYVETHGTGTQLGDPIEVGALSSVFRQRPKSEPLVLGSIKTNIGHLDAAAGIAGLIKVVLCLQRQQIPANLHFDEPNPRIDWETCPLKIPVETTPWPRGEKKRCAGVSSFGFSGTNSHVLLAEAPDLDSGQSRAEDAPERPLHLLALSAKSDEALSQLVRAYVSYLESPDLPALADICFTANAGRSHFGHRLAVLADSADSLRQLLSRSQNGKEGVWHGELPEQGREPVKIAWLFSGADIDALGSGGQGRQLYATHPAFRATIDRCSAVLAGQFDCSLSASFAPGEAQPGRFSLAYRHAAQFSFQYALFGLWRSWNAGPSIVAGWGVGEYAAACVAGIFALEDSLRLVVERGKLLSDIEHLSAAEAQAVLSRFEQSVAQVPCHKPRLPVVSGLTGELLSTATPPDAEYWRRQVQAVEPEDIGLKSLLEKNARHFLEIGPRCARTQRALSAQSGDLVYLSIDGTGDEWRAILSALAQLYACGLDLAWDAFDWDYPRQRQSLPTYPFQRQRYWFEESGRSERPASMVQTPIELLAPESAELQGEGSGLPDKQSNTFLSSEDQSNAPFSAEGPSASSIPSADAAAEKPLAAPPLLNRIIAQQLQTASTAISQVVAQQLEFLRANRVQPMKGSAQEITSRQKDASSTVPETPEESDTSATWETRQERDLTGRSEAEESPRTDHSAERITPPETAVAHKAESSSSTFSGTQKENGPTGDAEAQERASTQREKTARDAWQLLLLSASTTAELDAATQQLAKRLQQAPESLAEVAASLRQSAPLAQRRMLVCQDAEDAAAALASLDPKRVVTHAPRSGDRPVAFMFPGVGDHYVDMARGLYQSEPIFRDQVDQCCQYIAPHLGEDLRQVIYPEKSGAVDEPSTAASFDLRRMLKRPPADKETDELSQTRFNQPAVFIIEYALAKLWTSWGIAPQALIGYSVGEYVAACLAEVMSLEDALLLITQRAQLIQDMPAGSMLAVPLSESEIRQLPLDEALSISIISTPALCVIGGPPEAIVRLEQQLKERQVLCRQLPTTHAFHSSMLQALREPMIELAAGIRLSEPRIPFLSNVCGTWISAAQATDAHYWAEHTYQTVRFADGVGQLLQSFDGVILEVGPGQNLSSFVFQHPEFKKDRDLVVLPSLRNRYDKQADRAFMLNTVGKLWLSGTDLDWTSVV